MLTHQAIGSSATKDFHVVVPTQKVMSNEVNATAMFVSSAQTPYCQSEG